MKVLLTGAKVGSLYALFDLQGLYVTYKAFPEDEPGNAMNFLGIQDGTAAHIWQRIMELYFGTEDKTVLGRMEDKIRVAAAVRFLYLLTATPLKEHKLTDLRIRHTCEQLEQHGFAAAVLSYKSYSHSFADLQRNVLIYGLAAKSFGYIFHLNY